MHRLKLSESLKNRRNTKTGGKQMAAKAVYYEIPKENPRNFFAAHTNVTKVAETIDQGIEYFYSYLSAL